MGNKTDYDTFHGSSYNDPSFPAAESSLFWRKHLRGTQMPNLYIREVTGWARPSEIVKGHPSLWGSKGVLPAGTNQGRLGDCWFLAAAAALAEFPERIQKIFSNKSYPQNGLFQLTMYHIGQPKHIVIDDRLPVTEGRDRRYTNYGVKRPTNARVSRNGAWW